MFLLGISHTFHSQSQNLSVLPSTQPLISFTVLHIFPAFSTFRFMFHHHVRLSHVLHPEASRCRRSFCLLDLLAVVDHKLNTERKCVCRFCWWCACTCMAAPSLSSAPLLSPLPPPSGVSERRGMS